MSRHATRCLDIAYSDLLMEFSGLYAAAKALHLIGMVSWMSGAFYLVRIMVNHAEAAAKSEPERTILARQFTVMEWKVYRVIIKPAAIITWLFGTIMLAIQPGWLQQGWLHVKLLFVVGFTAYTLLNRKWIVALENGTSTFTHAHFRALNEVPTIILVAAVFLAVYKTGINWLFLTAGLLLFGGLIFSAVRRVARRQR
jgi:putative membrane protein